MRWQRGIVGPHMDWDAYEHHFYLCNELPREEFLELMDEWLVKYSILLLKEPSKGGSFVIRDQSVLLQKIETLRPKLMGRPDAEIGDDLVLQFDPSDLAQVNKEIAARAGALAPAGARRIHRGAYSEDYGTE